MKQNDLKVVRHATLRGCMEEYLGCEITELGDLQVYTWIWGDYDGEHSMPMKEAVEKILSSRVWGWLENKDTVHLWFDKNVDPKRLIAVIAHEIGHSNRPYHRDTILEEQKASRYEMAACTALDIMGDLLGWDR